MAHFLPPELVRQVNKLEWPNLPMYIPTDIMSNPWVDICIKRKPHSHPANISRLPKLCQRLGWILADIHIEDLLTNYRFTNILYWQSAYLPNTYRNWIKVETTRGKST